MTAMSAEAATFHLWQVYKQYRNAIIAKYRQDVKCRLSYADARAAVEVWVTCHFRYMAGLLQRDQQSTSPASPQYV